MPLRCSRCEDGNHPHSSGAACYCACDDAFDKCQIEGCDNVASYDDESGHYFQKCSACWALTGSLQLRCLCLHEGRTSDLMALVSVSRKSPYRVTHATFRCAHSHIAELPVTTVTLTVREPLL